MFTRIRLHAQTSEYLTLVQVAATGFGFVVVVLPTLLRALGVIGPSDEDRTRYPDRTWTIDSSAAAAKPRTLYGAVRTPESPEVTAPKDTSADGGAAAPPTMPEVPQTGGGSVDSGRSL